LTRTIEGGGEREGNSMRGVGRGWRKVGVGGGIEDWWL